MIFFLFKKTHIPSFFYFRGGRVFKPKIFWHKFQQKKSLQQGGGLDGYPPEFYSGSLLRPFSNLSVYLQTYPDLSQIYPVILFDPFRSVHWDILAIRFDIKVFKKIEIQLKKMDVLTSTVFRCDFCDLIFLTSEISNDTIRVQSIWRNAE